MTMRLVRVDNKDDDDGGQDHVDGGEAACLPTCLHAWLPMDGGVRPVAWKRALESCAWKRAWKAPRKGFGPK